VKKAEDATPNNQNVLNCEKLGGFETSGSFHAVFQILTVKSVDIQQTQTFGNS